VQLTERPSGIILAGNSFETTVLASLQEGKPHRLLVENDDISGGLTVLNYTPFILNRFSRKSHEARPVRSGLTIRRVIEVKDGELLKGRVCCLKQEVNRESVFVATKSLVR
jgi:hypothetical protein